VSNPFTALIKKPEDFAKKLDIDRIIQIMDELTRNLDKSEKAGANVVQDMHKRMEEKVDELVMTMEMKKKKEGN
jgi:hypothetical protein